MSCANCYHDKEDCKICREGSSETPKETWRMNFLDVSLKLGVLLKKYQKLEKENGELRKALEYYADGDGRSQDTWKCTEDFEYITSDGVYSLFESGKLARKTLEGK